ncbi:MAG: aminoacyl-tRNA hydrolase, partial [Bacteroidetes bacterium]|nr:aminoacyl-tRNA hydrolase [Bacteroidota bacterium]
MENVLRINSRVAIPETELRFRFSRSSGPGGQHVNKASTRVELLFDLKGSGSLTERQKLRLVRALGKKLGSDGLLRFVEEGSRSQWTNRKKATQRFVDVLRKALKPRKRRIPTRRSAVAQEKRL